jgi:hypothetical protein
MLNLISGKILARLIMESDLLEEKKRPSCFGDEAKFVNYLENSAADGECAKCPSENECGEYILLKCSRELIF